MEGDMDISVEGKKYNADVMDALLMKVRSWLPLLVFTLMFCWMFAEKGFLRKTKFVKRL